MNNFKIINNKSEVPSDVEWIDSKKFTKKFVDSEGKAVAADYAGHYYQIVAKQERKFTKWERFTRGLLGSWMVIRSLGSERSSKTVKKLFTKDHESRRFGIEHTTSTSKLPQELALKIFSFLNRKELATCMGVSTLWKGIASDPSLWNALPPKIAFTEEQWTTYFGDVGQVPPLPKDIKKILESPCPFWPNKKVEETHMLVLIPETVDGKPLTLTALGELVKKPKKGNANEFNPIDAYIINKEGNRAPDKSHWVLMTKDVIPKSRNNSYTEQKALIAERAKETGIDYEAPRLLDAAICIFMHNISSSERLFTVKPIVTYTRCHIEDGNDQNVVGGYGSNELRVFECDFNGDFYGMAAVRRFF